MEVLEKGVPVFLENMQDPMTDEFLIPLFADDMIRAVFPSLCCRRTITGSGLHLKKTSSW